MFRKMVWFSLILVSAFVAGCAQVPQESIDSVEQALDTARAAEAAEYAPGALQLAEDSLGSALTEVEAQKETFAMLRSYDAAEELLGKARGLADAATTEANTARDRAKADAEALIDQARVAIDAAMTALETAPQGKGTQAELTAMKAELDGLAASLDGAEQSYASGKYLMAKSQAESVAREAGAITADIAQATMKRNAT